VEWQTKKAAPELASIAERGAAVRRFHRAAPALVCFDGSQVQQRERRGGGAAVSHGCAGACVYRVHRREDGAAPLHEGRPLPRWSGADGRGAGESKSGGMGRGTHDTLRQDP
jgi:hypothetical protein